MVWGEKCFIWQALSNRMERNCINQQGLAIVSASSVHFSDCGCTEVSEHSLQGDMIDSAPRQTHWRGCGGTAGEEGQIGGTWERHPLLRHPLCYPAPHQQPHYTSHFTPNTPQTTHTTGTNMHPNLRPQQKDTFDLKSQTGRGRGRSRRRQPAKTTPCPDSGADS